MTLDEEQADVEAGRRLAALLPDDSFAQVCGLGGLVLEVRPGDGTANGAANRAANRAALWRGHPWGTGWTGGGSPDGVARLVGEWGPDELTVPAVLGPPPGYRQGWGWGWHATRKPPPVQVGEEHVSWLQAGDERLTELVARAFPDAETPPGDPRVARWFGARQDGRLVACAAELRSRDEAALLSSLTVEPFARRQGWGAAVTAWFTRRRLESGARVVGLGTYLSNDPARALYGQLGFADVPYIGAVRET